MLSISWFSRHPSAQPRAAGRQAHEYPPSTVVPLSSPPVTQMFLQLPRPVFPSSERGTAVAVVTLAVGAEAGGISNVEKQQLWCWLGVTVGYRRESAAGI